MLVPRLSAVFIVATAAFFLPGGQRPADAAALQRNNNDRSRHRGARGSRSDQERPYFWMCPEVLCPTISSDCETIEYIVFQYDYQVRGRMINVRCESCEYCLDGPFQKINRQRRSFPGRRASPQPPPSSSDDSSSSGDALCPHIQCPLLPPGCIDERLTDVLVGGSVCKRCPACYDSTVLNDV